mmetsp:Transcript_18529/g.63772  ORF Transcript_18529/g.63772 Transcript_18529/m.63772 type:complete len:215 (-) Transcript_18529:544-1188(-)
MSCASLYRISPAPFSPAGVFMLPISDPRLPPWPLKPLPSAALAAVSAVLLPRRCEASDGRRSRDDVSDGRRSRDDRGGAESREERFAASALGGCLGAAACGSAATSGSGAGAGPGAFSATCASLAGAASMDGAASLGAAASAPCLREMTCATSEAFAFPSVLATVSQRLSSNENPSPRQSTTSLRARYASPLASKLFAAPAPMAASQPASKDVG